jgi:serine/threonine protein kinase
LENLHSLGFVHCDIKPDNILENYEGNKKILYLIDFGISHEYLAKDG